MTNGLNGDAKSKSLVSISQAAAILGVSIDTVRRWDKAGVLKSTRPDGKNRYFSIEELERAKLNQPLSISEAAKMLKISSSTLRRLEGKGLISPIRNGHNERRYDRKTLEKFLNSEYFIRQKEIEEEVLEPLKASNLEEALQTADEDKEPTEKQPGTGLAVRHLVTEHHTNIHRLRRRVLLGFGILGVVLIPLGAAIIALTAAFLINPSSTAKTFGLSLIPGDQGADVKSATTQINTGLKVDNGLKYVDHRGWKDDLRPLVKLSLLFVNLIDDKKYAVATRNLQFADVNQVFQPDAQGKVQPLYTLYFDSDKLALEDQGLIVNLNSDFVDGREPGNENGDLAILPIDGTDIIDASITTEDIADGSITSEKLAAGIKIDGNTTTGSSITEIIAGDGLAGGGDKGAVTIKVGAGEGISLADNSIAVDILTTGTTTTLDSNSGLEVSSNGVRLIGGCSSGEILKWNSSAWACSTDDNSGGGGGVSDGDKGDISVSGSGTIWTIDPNSVALGADTTNDYVASFTAGGGLTGNATGEGSTPTLAVGAGNGIAVNADTIEIKLDTTAADGATASSVSGLELAGSELSLLRGCSQGDVLKWDNTGFSWGCASDNAGGGGANTFETINTPAGTDPVADSSTDTLNLAASGTNLTITGDSATDTVTLNLVESVLAGAGLVANVDGLDITTGNGIQISSDAVALGPLSADWSQTGAFDIVLNNSSSELKLLESGASPSFFAILDVGDLAADSTFTLSGSSGTLLSSANYSGTLDPVYVNVGESPATGDITGSFSAGLTVGLNAVALGADTTNDYVASFTAGAGLTGNATGEGSTPTINIVSANGGIVANTDDIALTLQASGNALSTTTSSGSGMEILAGGLTLLQGCGDTEILKWNETSDVWACQPDVDTDTDTHGNAFTTIDVSGTDAVADSTTDTLVLAASGTNLTINGSADDTVTFNIDETALAGSGLAANGDALDVSTGDGLEISGDAVRVDQDFVFTWTADHTFNASVLINEAGADTITLGSIDNLDTFSLNSTGLRIDTSGNLTNTGNITGAGGLTLASGAAGNLTLNAGLGNIIFSDGDVLAIGGVAAGLTYNAIANSGGSANSGLVADDNDLFVQGGLEVDGSADIAGTATATNFQLAGQSIAAWNAIPLTRVAGSTYSTLQHFFNQVPSPGRITGGVITDAGSGNINVSAGTGLIRATDDDIAELKFFDWAAASGIAIPANSKRYVGVQYNAGSPQVFIKAADTWDYDTEFPLGVVINEGGTLHITNNPQWTGDAATNVIERFYGTNPFVRDKRTGGLIIGETGTRNLTVSAGKLWDRLNEFDIAAIDTSGTDTFDRYYRNGSGGYIKESAQTQWNNTQYDDGSGTLATLTDNYYSAQWFYVQNSGKLLSVYDQNQYSSLAEAQDANAPAAVPERISDLSTLIGRVLFQKNAASASRVETAFETFFSGSVVTDHGALSGLADDDHSQYALLAGRSGGQSLFGGTAAGEDLILDSTANVSKGYIILQQNGGLVGIGTATPSAILHVTAPTAPVNDLILASNSGQGTVTDQVDGLQINLVTAAAVGDRDNAGIRLVVDPAGATEAGDRVSAIDIAGITNPTGTTNAFRIGANWDNIFDNNGTFISAAELNALDDGIALGSETSNDYVATITAGAGLTGDASGEGSTPTLAVGAGDGITAAADSITLDLGNSLAVATGLQVDASGLSMIETCADNELLKWTDAGGWACAADDNSTTTRLDQITAATGEGTAQDSNANSVFWNWDFTSAAIDSGLTISESSASTSGTQDQQALLELVTLATSTASPLQVTAGGTDVGDVWFNLSGTADFEIRDGGTAFATFDDSGGVTVQPNGASDAIFTLDDDSNVKLNSTYTGAASETSLAINLTHNEIVGGSYGYGLSVTNTDNGANFGVPTALAYLNNANAAETVTSGLIVGQTGTGTLTNGIEIIRTAGAITNGLTFTGTFTNLINATNFDVSNAGTVTVAAGQSYTGSGALTVSSGGANILTVDAGGAANVDIGTTNANAVNISKAGALTTVMGSSAFDELVSIGNASGNDYLEFTEEAGNPTCGAGLYAVWANSTDGKLKKCQNGTVTDLDTGGAGSATLQEVYNNSTSPATIDLATGKNLVINAPDVATDPDFLFNIATGSTSKFEIQSNGDNMLTIQPSSATEFLFKADGDSTTGFVIQDASGNNGLAFNTSSSELRIFENIASPTDYALIKYESGEAVYSASAGTVRVGTGSGPITIQSGTDSDVTITPGGTGDLVLALDDDSNFKFCSSSCTVTNTGSLQDINLTLGNDATADTVSALNIDVTSVDTGADSDILRGIDIANLSGGNANVTEVALNIGTGWDTLIGGTTAGSNIFSFTNASLTSAGALTVASCTGCGGGSLQTAYDSGATIETAGGVPVVITETSNAAHTLDLLQLTVNPATGGTFAGDGLQITMDAADAGAYTGNGLKIVVDVSQIANGGLPLTIEDDLGSEIFGVNKYGFARSTRGFVSYDGYFSQDFNFEIANSTAESLVFGDDQRWKTDEITACTFGVIEGAVSYARLNSAASTGCLIFMGTAIGNSSLITSVSNLPRTLVKAKPTRAAADGDTWVGLWGNHTTNAEPAEGVYFTNADGGNWVGRVNPASGSNIDVACGVAVSTTQFALLEMIVESSTVVRFKVDPDISNGINFTDCGTANPSGVTSALGVAAMISTTVSTSFDLQIDYFRVWTDDPPVNSQSNPSATTEVPYDSDIKDAPPITSDLGTLDAQNGLINFLAAIGEDAVFDHDVYVRGTLYADKIKANQIEGLEILAGKISSLETKTDSLAEGSVPTDDSAAGQNSAPEEVDLTKVSFDSPVTAVSLTTLGQLETQGGLTVTGDALFKGKSVFMALAEFRGRADFNDLVNFYGRAVFNKDAGGHAVIKQGAAKVQIKFSSPYEQPPIVVANFELEDSADGADTAEAKQQRLVEGGYSYAVGNVTASGFTIYLNKTATEDINFSWLATAIKNAAVTLSDEDREQ
ncbi:MAG: MerR family DNA-binding transcriptional regulator [Candidatus Saccharimonadales bacterium]